MAKKLEGAGLRGQVAGETSLCTVGQEEGLAYRGHKIELLAEKATFEEVAYLLIYGKLPTQTELDAYKSKLKSLRDLPTELKVVLQNIPASAHPMDVMRTGTSMLGNLEPEGDFENQLDSINRMIATMASIVTYWYKYSHEGVDISLVNDEDTIAGHFLHILHGKPPSELHKKVMDTSLILYAEHEFNASTFTARVCASTMSDIFSCVVAAIGSLRGPLHGGANEAAMDMIENWKTRDEAKSNILSMLQNKEKIMGFGHAVYLKLIQEMQLSRNIQKNCQKNLVIVLFTKSLRKLKKLCGMKRNYLLMLIFFMPQHIFTWEYQRNYLLLFL